VVPCVEFCSPAGQRRIGLECRCPGTWEAFLISTDAIPFMVLRHYPRMRGVAVSANGEVQFLPL
jgi:hypothetical protein